MAQHLACIHLDHSFSHGYTMRGCLTKTFAAFFGKSQNGSKMSTNVVLPWSFIEKESHLFWQLFLRLADYSSFVENYISWSKALRVSFLVPGLRLAKERGLFREIVKPVIFLSNSCISLVSSIY